MTLKKAFERLMAEQGEVALATVAGGEANVRIVNFLYDNDSKRLYFSTFKGNQKVQEFAENPRVALTTVPGKGENAHVRIKGSVQKSALTIYDLADKWVAKLPFYQENIENAGSFLDTYEVFFDKALVVLDMENSGEISI